MYPRVYNAGFEKHLTNPLRHCRSHLCLWRYSGSKLEIEKKSHLHISERRNCTLAIPTISLSRMKLVKGERRQGTFEFVVASVFPVSPELINIIFHFASSSLFSSP